MLNSGSAAELSDIGETYCSPEQRLIFTRPEHLTKAIMDKFGDNQATRILTTDLTVNWVRFYSLEQDVRARLRSMMHNVLVRNREEEVKESLVDCVERHEQGGDLFESKTVGHPAVRIVEESSPDEIIKIYREAAMYTFSLTSRIEPGEIDVDLYLR